MANLSVAKSLLCCALLGIIAGCKIAVIVIEGGEVQSDSSGTCVAGTICIVEVTDANFFESFEAVLEEGWYFHGWNSGDRFLCAGSTNVSCNLGFQGHEESEAVADMVASSETFYLMPVFKDFPPGGDKEWLDLNESYPAEQISAVCPPPSGVCSGSLPNSAVDLTGYRWALPTEVGELFNSYGTSQRQFFDDFGAALDKGELIHYGLARAPADDEYIAYITSASYGLSDGTGSMHTTALGIESGSENPIAVIAAAWFWRPINN
jgi:hypothetical protein